MQISQTFKRWYGLFGHWLNLRRQSAENTHLVDKLNNYTPILIYQMGKVGSSSIYWPLKKVYPGAVIHIHNFRSDHPAEEVRILYKYLKENPAAEVKIISLVRDPIARNISAFFQNFKRFVGCRAEDYKGSTLELQNTFIDTYQHRIPHEWFDNRLLRDFNIDVFNKAFPEKGYQVYKNANISVLVIRQYLPNATKEKIVREFTTSQSFSMTQVKNQASDKLYAELYQTFKSLPLPLDYVKQQFSTKYAQHFFSPAECERLINRWSQK